MNRPISILSPVVLFIPGVCRAALPKGKRSKQRYANSRTQTANRAFTTCDGTGAHVLRIGEGRGALVSGYQRAFTFTVLLCSSSPSELTQSRWPTVIKDVTKELFHFSVFLCVQ